MKGMGPFSLLGSSDDSDASCQPDVQDCSPCLVTSVVGTVLRMAKDLLQFLDFFRG